MYSLQQSRDRRVARFSQLIESGLSKEDAWKVMAVEILTDAGLVISEQLEPPRASGWAESVQIPVSEAKLLKPVRIDPADDDKIRKLLEQERRESAVSKGDPPSESSIIRRALRLGLDALEKERGRK